MKTLLKMLGLSATLGLVLAGPIRAQNDAQDNEDTTSSPLAATDATGNSSDGSVSFQTFYDQLSQYGTWINTNQYGYVFQPRETDPNWRPYTYGHWVNTDAGMTWVSDEPFGWATDHYGRWTNLDGTGWVWVPGYTWAPAWVSWRQDDNDVGWAPLPPDSDEGIDYYSDDDDYGDYWGYHIGDDCDLAYGIGPWWYNFCPIVWIGDNHCWRHFHDRRDNFALIHHTRNITNLNFRRDGAGRFGHVRAEGPNVAALNARSHTPIQTARLASATSERDSGLHGSTLSVFAPRVDPATANTSRPAGISERLAGTTVNRGTNIYRPVAVNSRLSPAAATPEQVHAATEASIAGNDRIATTHTEPSHVLSEPITSLHTGARAQGFDEREIVHETAPAAAYKPSNNVRFSSYNAPRTFAPGVDMTPGFHGASSYPAETYRSTELDVAPHRTQTYDDGPVYHASAPIVHSYNYSYHPQPSFRSYSYTPSYGSIHYSTPVGHFSAPATHFSGGSIGSGFSGGGFHSSGFSGGISGGGGGFSGGGHAGGGGGHR
jgi:hypothetical protein